jgi:CheY-like chemotaxis protein
MMRRHDRIQATILVWDANPITLLATAGVLDAGGYVCFCARNEAAANQVPARCPVDAAVIDVGADAEQVLRFIPSFRQLAGNAQLPVVLIADAMWAGLERQVDALAEVRVLFKPIDPNVLLDVVRQALWMPPQAQGVRARGSRQTHPGWIEL